MLFHASRSRYIDPGRPPAADGGLRSQYPDLVLAVGSRSTAGSCSRLGEEYRPAPSTRGRKCSSTWQPWLSSWPSEPHLTTSGRATTLSRYVARLKPRCGFLALSVMWYVLTVSQVGDMARFE